MMTVYLDEVFFLNALVNWLLLETAASLTGSPRHRGRLAAGAVFGGLYAAAASFPALAPLGTVPGRLLAYGLLCLICFGWKGPVWKSWLWFFVVCCAFAGLVLAAAALLSVPVFLRGGRVYYRLTGRLLIALAGAVYLVCRLCLDRFAKHRGGELVRLELELGGKKAACTALRDSGNTLCEPVTGQSVIVARWQLAQRLLPELGLQRELFSAPAEGMRLLRFIAPELKPVLIPYRAVGTQGGLLLALRMDSIRENGSACPTQLVAFSPTEISDGGVFEALCHA